jgi:ribosome-binding protein aMBF1 (putative translation factor)
MDSPARPKPSRARRKPTVRKTAPHRSAKASATGPVGLQQRLATVIRRRREALGVSQEAFADGIQMHRTYYGAIERGSRNMTLKSLEKVAAGLGELLSRLIAEAEKS